MASFLQKSNPWIENTFTYASSFDPDTGTGFGGGSGCSSNNNVNEDDEDSDANLFDSQYYDESEPQTNNTIPSGLLPSPDEKKMAAVNNVGNDEFTTVPIPPSRQSKIAQVITRGGDFEYYNKLQKQQQANNNNNNRSSSCPPYLIIHDGQYSAITFLSRETISAQRRIPPNKSLISISNYTVSTILECTSFKNKTYQNQIINSLSNSSLLPPQHYSQLKYQVSNTNLYLCLYVQSPITIIGAENQGLIGNPLDVHCSIWLRRVLIAHDAQHGSGGGGGRGNNNNNECDNGERGKDDNSYNVLMTRLEAVHCYYQDLARRKLNAQQIDQQHHHQQQQLQQIMTSSSPAASSIGSPGSIYSASSNTRGGRKRKKKMYGKRNNKKKSNVDEEVVEDVTTFGSNGGTRSDSVGGVVIPPDWPWESRLMGPDDYDELGNEYDGGLLDSVQEEDVAEGEGKKDDDDAQNLAEKESVAERGSAEETTEATSAAARNQNHVASIQCGNVIDLFDNFDDVDDILDIEESTDEVVANTSSLQREKAPPESTEATADESMAISHDAEGQTSQGQDSNAASFVGIDDMLVDDSEDDEDGGNFDGLLTQPEYTTNDDRDENEDEEGGYSQLPMSFKQNSHRKKVQEEHVEESQVPLLARRTSRKSPRRMHNQEEEDEVAFDPQSQIPLPVRRLSKKQVTRQNEEEQNDYAASQLPIPTRKRSKRGRRHLNDQEDDAHVPISLRKAPPETLIENEVVKDDGLQSQVPLPTKKSPKKLIGSPSVQDEEMEGDDFGPEESQIPLPQMRKQKSKLASPQTSPKKKQRIEETEHGMVEMSQMPLKAKQKPTRGALKTKQKPTHTSPSRRELNNDSDDSSDDWMQVRKTKPKAKSRRSKAPGPTKQMKPADVESAEDDEPPSSQPSGEGSEETVPQQLPPIQPQTKKRLSDKQPVAPKGVQEDEEYFENTNDELLSDSNEEDEILLSQEDTKQQNESASESNDKPLRVGNHIRFSVAHSENEPVVDDLDMASLSSKAFAILGETSQPPDITNVDQSTEYEVGKSIDNNSENEEEQQRKKRKTSFDMGQFLQDTKKQALSWL